MYNLLMVGAGGYWDDRDIGEYELSRYLEYTNEALKQRFEPVTDVVVAELMSYPALFAYEFPTKMPARVGRITEIRRRLSELSFKFEFDDAIAPITPEQIEKLAWDLDIGVKGECYRTHWAVKDVDLLEVLRKANLLSPAPRLDQKKAIETLAAGLAAASSGDKAKVFVVHGRDDAIKHDVARFIERIGLEAVILHEQANGGRTLITKFQEVAAKVGFAVVLMTPDDNGGLAGQAQQPRARQNVIFELGFFIGKLGADRVCALVAGPVERPSDFDAVVYISYDARGGWKLDLAKEFKEAGISFDPYKIF